MGRILTAILTVLVLYLAAVNARLRERIRGLERRPAPAAVAKKPAAAPRLVETVDAPLPAPPTPAAAVEAPRAAVRAPERRQHMVLMNRMFSGEPDLSEAQKTLIDQLKKNRDAETQVYRDLVRAIEERTERSIQDLLTPEQRRALPGAAAWTVNVLAEAATEDRPSGYLGVAGEDGAAGGARLSQVLPNTPAELSGLRAGDVVLDFNGQPLPDYGALASRMRETSPGQAVVLSVQRDGTVFQHVLEVGPRPR